MRRCIGFAAGLTLALGLVLATSVAQAGTILPGQYYLLDHGNGDLGPDYGLRVDAIGETFSFELGGAQVILDWDGGATATISGTALNNSTQELWNLSYTLTGVTDAGGNLGFSASAGSGTLTDPLSNISFLTGEQDTSGSVFDFLADGFRISGDTDTPVGRGWLLPEGTVDDFLVRGQVVPEPGTALLLGLGLTVIGIRQRRR